MTITIENFISWKADETMNTVSAWFDHAGAVEAGLVRRGVAMRASPSWSAECIEQTKTGEYVLVEAGTTHATLEEAKCAALKSAVEYILEEYPPFAR